MPNISDFPSHLRRMGHTDPIAKLIGFDSNFMRYTLNLAIVDEIKRMFRTMRKSNNDFYGFGVPVCASGNSVVVATRSEQRDSDSIGRLNSYMWNDKISRNPMSISVNCVVIDHRKGETA